MLILGFTSGAIQRGQVNRLLLRNISVVGVGLGAFEASAEPTIMATLGAELNELVATGRGRSSAMSTQSRKASARCSSSTGERPWARSSSPSSPAGGTAT